MINIIDEKKNLRNELLNRQEIEIIVESDQTPSISEAKKLISERYNKEEDCINVCCIKGKFGRRNFLIKAEIYDSKEILEKLRKKKEKKEDTKKEN